MEPDDIKLALELWLDEKPKEAMDLLRPLSEKGNSLAKAELGGIMINYYEKEEFPLLEEGAQLLREAMEEGQPSAAHNLGNLYIGLVPTLGKDLKEAARCFLKSKELGGPIADEGFYEHWEEMLNG